MTHDEAIALLPSYALGALDEEVAALEAHLDQCDQCGKIFAALLETTTALAEAVEPIPPPLALREGVLRGFSSPTAVPESEPLTAVRPPSGFRLLTPRFSPVRSLVAALLILTLGFGAGTIVQIERSRVSQAELTLDQRGLALLTSTETRVERLAPIANPTSEAHGHWYHRDGVPTQVVVGEFLPPLTGGDSYFGWLGLADGTWEAVGLLPIDERGSGRAIILGSDGTGVRSVVVTRQPGFSASPSGAVILRWAAS